MTTTPYILTNSEMTSWQHCPRCWYLGYYRCLSKITDYKKTLAVGTLFHHALEAYYGGRADPLEYVRVKVAAMIEANPEAAEYLAKDAELVGIMIQGYLEDLEEKGSDANLEIVSVETKLDVFLRDDLILRGKLDARALNRVSGARLFLEHKTVQNFVDLPRTAQTNPQFLTYELLEYMDMIARGEDPAERTDGLLLNMAKKVKRTVRAKPPFYDRKEIHFNVEELRNHYRTVTAVADTILEARSRLDDGQAFRDVTPPTNTRECFWKCNFSALCMSGMMDDGSDWEGFVADLYEIVDPLKRYEEEEEQDAG